MKIGKIKFTDEFVPFGKWGELKQDKSTVFGSLPTMTLSDGTDLAQARAILRLVGKETGLYPKDSFAAAICDVAIDAADDLMGESWW